MLDNIAEFGVVDSIVFAASLTASLGIGIFFAYADRKDESTSTYLFGDRKMSALPVSISMAVTFISALTVIAMPVEVYLYGVMFIWGVVGSSLGVVASAIYFVPLYCRLKVKTVFEILELRFHKPLRLAISVMATVQYIVYMGVASYLPPLAISAITPISIEASILLTIGLCTTYTALGGLKAVVWTDVIQGAVMLLGCVSVVIKVAVVLGGFRNIWSAVERGGRGDLFEFTLDPRVRANMPAFIVGYFVFAFKSTAIEQPLVQRYISCGSTTVAKRACYYKLIPLGLFKTIAVITGLSCYAYFEGCDPKLSGAIEKHDQTIPYLVVTLFQNIPGFSGLFVAAAFCGTLSTVSSGLNSVATVFVHDFVLLWKPKLSGKRQLFITKFCCVIVGLLVGIVSLLCTKFKGTVIRILFASSAASSGPILAMFSFMFVPMVSNKGATGALIVGSAFSWFLAIGTLTTTPNPDIAKKLELSTSGCDFNMTESWSNFTAEPVTLITNPVTSPRTLLQDTLFSLTPYVLTLLTTTVTFLSAIIISLITGRNKSSDLNPEYFIPLVSNERLPKSVIKFFRFGVPEMPPGIDKKINESSEYYELTKEEMTKLDDGTK